jgi:hypothetical protein
MDNSDALSSILEHVPSKQRATLCFVSKKWHAVAMGVTARLEMPPIAEHNTYKIIVMAEMGYYHSLLLFLNSHPHAGNVLTNYQSCLTGAMIRSDDIAIFELLIRGMHRHGIEFDLCNTMDFTAESGRLPVLKYLIKKAQTYKLSFYPYIWRQYPGDAWTSWVDLGDSITPSILNSVYSYTIQFRNDSRVPNHCTVYEVL